MQVGQPRVTCGGFLWVDLSTGPVRVFRRCSRRSMANLCTDPSVFRICSVAVSSASRRRFLRRSEEADIADFIKSKNSDFGRSAASITPDPSTVTLSSLGAIGTWRKFLSNSGRKPTANGSLIQVGAFEDSEPGAPEGGKISLYSQ